MNQMPLISVIVPVYKVEAYLDKCIRSIVEQTYPNLEIILVDDGSPDRCGEICDAWAKKDSRIRVIHKENGGAGLARNVALDQANGELIGFVDSDDYIAPDMYRQLYELIADGADIAECDFLETYDDNALFSEKKGDITKYTSTQAMRLHINEHAFQQLIWNKLYSREVIGDVRFPMGTKIDDEFFTYIPLSRAQKLAHTSSCLYAYRQQPNSIMHQPFSLQRLQGISAKTMRLNYIREHMPELVEEGEIELFLSCLYSMQSCFRWLDGEELESARMCIRKVLGDICPLKIRKTDTLKRKLLLAFAQLNFENTCKVLNFLQDIHVIT